MKLTQTIVRIAAIYNLSAAATFLTPGLLPLLGIETPLALWLWLPSIFGCFAAVVLWLSARDLKTYGSFPYWNGWFRLTFVVVVFLFNLGAAGAFITWLALGDLVLALGTIFGIKYVTKKSHFQLLTNS